jgi:SAM-dependent methyltransferase
VCSVIGHAAAGLGWTDGDPTGEYDTARRGATGRAGFPFVIVCPAATRRHARTPPAGARYLCKGVRLTTSCHSDVVCQAHPALSFVHAFVGRYSTSVMRTCSFDLPLTIRCYRALARGLNRVVVDRALNVETSRPVALAEFGLDAPDRVGYEAGGWLDLPRVLRAHEARRDGAFLDLGSGKGRILLQAAQYRFARVIGVEISESLTAIAHRNVASCRLTPRCGAIEIVNCDAVDYTIPDDMSVIYLNNPFREAIFESVLTRLQESIDRRPRTARLIYRNAVHHDELVGRGFTLERSSPGWRPTSAWRERTAIRVYALAPSEHSP